MKKLFSFQRLLLLTGLISFQEGMLMAQHDYLAYNASSKIDLFSDGFADNSFQWITDNLWVSGKIEGGFYNIKCKDYQLSTGLSFKPIVIATGSDYEIEASIKVIKGTGALVFGMTDKYDHYRVEISDNNTFEIIKDTPSKKKKIEKIYSGTGNSQLINGYNKITVRCVYNTFYVFLNETLVGQYIYIKTEGDGIGFNVGLESEISVDYLKVSRLGSITAPLTAQKEAVKQDAQQPAVTEKSVPAVVTPDPPVITWVTPFNTRTTQGTSGSTIRASIRSSVELTSVVLYQNGVSAGTVAVSSLPGEAGSYTFEKTVSLGTGENTLHLIAVNAGASTTSDMRYFTFVPPPPQIAWSSPLAMNTTLASSRSDIRASIRSESELKSVTLFFNGVSAGSIPVTPSSGGTYLIEKTLDFNTGENHVYLVATNAGGSTTSETRNFTNPPPAPVVQPVAQVVPAANAAPVITWTSPSGLNTTLESFNATVKATVKSGSGLKSVLLYLNGISKGEAEITQVPGETVTFQIEKNLNFGPGENNVYFVATNSEGATKSDPRYFSNPFAVAPVITWSNPESSNIKVNIENFTIEASIKSPSDLKSVKLIVNGETQTEDNIFQPSGSDISVYTWQSSALLKKGDNSIYVSATNIAGTKRSEQRIIKYEAAMTEKRLALVLGNSLYKTGIPLKNPVNDANLMEGTLKQLGFDVIKRLNATKAEMETAIREFTEKLPNYNVALFYYAGHGNQVDGKNFLIPTDALLEKPTDCKFEAISVNFVVDEFERYPDNANIVILDACRNNPYANWARGTGDAGFRQVTSTSGTIIAFATSEGATAADGKGDNGLYTEELVKQMVIPQSLHNVFLNTRVQVKKLSNNTQVPIEWDQLNSDYYLMK